MKHNFKRFLSLVLAILMVFSMFTGNIAYAADEGTNPPATDGEPTGEGNNSEELDTPTDDDPNQASANNQSALNGETPIGDLSNLNTNQLSSEADLAAISNDPAPIAADPVAKVGSTEYATIDDAIAAWTNNTTLTLLADVTLSDVISLSSTEYHVLDLGTFTMTAANGKDVIQYVINGRSSAGYALDIKADATNPGGINATGGSVVRHTKPLLSAPSKDRPITRFYGGVFNATYIVRQGGTFGAGYTGASAPYFQFYGGEFNGTIYTNRSQNQFHGGVFNGSMQMSVDSSAYTLVAAGTFKNLSNLMGSELNSDKFAIGSAKGVYDREVYVNDEGYTVVASAAPAEGYEASVAVTLNSSRDYLAYSTVATEGKLNYTDATLALKNNKSATVTVYADELDLAGINFTGTIVVPEGKTLTITNAPEGLKYEGNVVIVKLVAKVGDNKYETLAKAISAANPDDTITLIDDVEENVTISKNLTIDGANFDYTGKMTVNAQLNVTVQNVDFVKGCIDDPDNAHGYLTVKNCTFDGVDKSIGYAISVRGGDKLTIENSSAKNYSTGMLYIPSAVAEFSIKDVTVENVAAAFNISYSGNGTFESVTLTNVTYGIHFQIHPDGSRTYTVKDCDLRGATNPFWFWDKSNNTEKVTVVFEGENVVPKFQEIAYTTSGILKLAADATLTAPEDIIITTDVKDCEVVYENGVYTVVEKDFVAQVEDNKYETLAEAVAAANAIEGGATITLLSDVTLGEKITISGNVTISGKYTITRADDYTGTLFTVSSGATLTLDGGLVIDGGNEWTYKNDEIVLKYGGDTYLSTHVAPEEGAPVATDDMFDNYGTLVVNNATVQNSYANSAVSVFYNQANASIILNGAVIKRNVSCEDAVIVAVDTANGSLTIKGSTVITENMGASNGGIIHVYGNGSIFSMEGGRIEGNYVVTSNSNNSSGTVICSYSGSSTNKNTVKLSGGVITNNHAEGYGTLYIHSNTVFEMSGGEVSNNTSYYPCYARSSGNETTITGGKITNNWVAASSYQNYSDIYSTSPIAISGGTFTQDVTKYLAPNTGLEYDEETKTYGTTKALYEYERMPYATLSEALAKVKVISGITAAETPVIKVLASHKVAETTTIDKDIILDLNGKTITAASTVDPVFRIEADVTVTGTGKIDARNGVAYAFILGKTDGTVGNLTIEDGTFYGETTVASVTNGTLTINGGNFAINPYKVEGQEDNYNYLLNCIDANYKAGTAKIVVNGGVFYKYNPSNNAAEGAGTNFCADGYIAEELNPNYWTVRAVNYVAQVGEIKYESLKAALEACTNGATVILLKDIELSESIKVKGTVTLDLSGKTITGTDNATGSFGLIEIQPGAELTINDTSTDGTGKITLTATNDRNTNAYSSVISNQRGKLTVEGGTIEHLGGTYMAYGIDNLTNGKGTYAETVINGGTVKSTYRAIRQFLNGVEAQNILTVNGGTIEGANKSIWMQDPNKNANSGTLTVSENAVLNGDVYLFVTAGSTEWPVEVSIAASAVNGEVLTGNVPEGYVLQNINGVYTVQEQTKVTITVENVTMVAGNKLPEFTYTSSVDVPGLTVELSTTADGKTAGEFEITATATASDPKYVFEIVPGKLTVEAAAVRVYAINSAKVKYFTSLEEALEYAVPQIDYVPIYLLGNITLTAPIVIADDRANAMELQGNKTGGNTFTLTSAFDGPMFKIESGKLSVKNLKIDAQGDAFYVTGGELNLNYHSAGKQFIEVTSQTGNCIYVRGGNVNVNGAKLTSLGEYPAIQGNGNYAGNVTLTKWTSGDGTYPVISAPNTDIAIYWPQNGKLTVEGGKITGDTALYAKSGNIVINGGEFIGTGDAKAYEPYGNGAYATGDAVVIETSTDAAYETPTVSITGGTFTSANAQPIAVYGEGTAVEKFITGGTTNKPVELKYCAEGYASVYVDGVYVVQECVAIAGNLGYMTLGEAVAAAENGHVILMKDVDLANEKTVTLDGKYNTYFLVDDKTVTINLNDKTISGTYNGESMLVGVFSTDNGGNLTLTGNGTVDVTASSTVYGLVVNYEPGCYTTIENGTFTLDKASDSLIYTGGDEGVTVKGGTFTLGNVGTGANGSPWIFNAKGQNTANVTVTGGTFNANVALQYWAHEVDIEDGEGNLSYIIDNKDGTWTVSGKPAEVAILTDVAGNYDLALGYATFKDAVASIAKGAPETTIVLQKDITVKGQFIGHSYAQDVIIDLNEHKMSSTDKALTVYRSGTEVTIKNGTVHGNTTGGTIQVTYGGKLTLGENTTITCGGSANALKVDANSTLIIADDSVKVQGGKNDLIVADGAKVEISAGSFKYPVKAEWCAEGYIPTEKLENGYYSVMKDPAYGMEAKAGDNYYETLAAAIEAAQNGDTVTLLIDIEVNNDDLVDLDGNHTFFKVDNKAITVNLNGKIIYADASAVTDKFVVGVFSTTNGGKLTLTGNGTVKGYSGETQDAAYLDPAKGNTDYNYKFYTLLVAYDEGCCITVENGTYSLDYSGDSLIYTSCNEGVVVNGGTFTLGNLGGIRNGMPWIFNARGQNQRHVIVNGGSFCADIQHQYYPFEVQMPKEKALKNENGMYTVVDAVAYVTEREWSSAWYTNEVGYATLEEAIAACEGPKTKLVGKKQYTSEPEEIHILNAKEVKTAGDLASEIESGETNVALSGDIAVEANTEMLLEASGDFGFNGNGKTITTNGTGTTPGSSNDYGYVGFIPANGEDAVVRDVKVVGSGFVEVGHHKTSTGGNYSITNLVIENLKATLAINNGGNNIAAAFSHYGNATMTNCVMTGTTCEKEGFKPYDAAFVNGTKTTIIGGKFNNVYLANQAHVTITGAEIDVIDSCAITTRNLGKLTIGAGTKVGTINLTPGKYTPALVIEDGAQVDAIVYSGVTYTVTEWLAR